MRGPSSAVTNLVCAHQVISLEMPRPLLDSSLIRKKVVYLSVHLSIYLCIYLCSPSPLSLNYLPSLCSFFFWGVYSSFLALCLRFVTHAWCASAFSAIFIGNCVKAPERRAYMTELMQYLPIQSFGGCMQNSQLTPG